MVSTAVAAMFFAPAAGAGREQRIDEQLDLLRPAVPNTCFSGVCNEQMNFFEAFQKTLHSLQQTASLPSFVTVFLSMSNKSIMSDEALRILARRGSPNLKQIDRNEMGWTSESERLRSETPCESDLARRALILAAPHRMRCSSFCKGRFSVHADALLSAIKELMDASRKPLTKEQETQVIQFCEMTFGSADSGPGRMGLFHQRDEAGLQRTTPERD